MKVNKMGKKNIPWKVKFWVMPVLYLMAWGVNAYVLASPQAMTIGITIVLFINLFVFFLLFKSQFNLAKDSVVNILFIDNVVSRKIKNSFLVWFPLVVIGSFLGVIGFIVLSTIALWFSAFVFLFSRSVDFNIISPGALVNIVNKGGPMEYYEDTYDNSSSYVGMVNPSTGLVMINGAYDSAGNVYSGVKD